jgi:hypothetical protein
MKQQIASAELATLGVPEWIARALGGPEALAALLFRMPATRTIGGSVLLVILAIAIPIPFAHGQFAGIP